MYATSRFQLSTGMHHRFVSIVAEGFEKKQLCRGTRVARPEQTCMKHARSVENDRIAGRNQIDEIAKLTMRDHSRIPMHYHQPALIASLGWNLRYLIVRKMKVVMIGSAAVSHQKSEGCGDPPDGIVNPK